MVDSHRLDWNHHHYCSRWCKTLLLFPFLFFFFWALGFEPLAFQLLDPMVAGAIGRSETSCRIDVEEQFEVQLPVDATRVSTVHQG